MGGHRGAIEGRRERWPWLAVLPVGLGSWAPLIAAWRDRSAAYAAVGLGWLAVTVTAFVLTSSERHSQSPIAGYLFLLSWVGGAISAFAIRSRRERMLSEPSDAGEPDGVAIIPSESLPEDVQPAMATPGFQGRRDRWPWVSVAPIGLGSWAPLIAGIRCRHLGWSLLGLAWASLTVGGFVLAAAIHKQTDAGIGGLMILGSWAGGIVTSFAIRSRYEWRRHGIPLTPVPWPRPTERSRRWTARYGLVAYVTTFAAVIALGFVLTDVVDVNVEVGPSVLIVDAGLLLALVPLRRSGRLSAIDLGLRPTLGLRSLGLVVGGLLAYALVAALWVLAIHPASTTRAARDLVTTSQLNTLNVVLAVIALSASAPIVEEVFFRGLLYRSLRNRLPVLPAALIAGALFGLVHITGYPLDTLPVKAAFGVIACLLYERTGSLLPGIALHSFVDASAIDAVLTGDNFIVLIVAGALTVLLFARAAERRVTGRRARSAP